MNNTNILVRIQGLTKELDMLKRSLNYKDELRATKDEIEELAREKFTLGQLSTYLVISEWLFEAILDDQRHLENDNSRFDKEHVYYYDTTVSNLQVIPLNVTERVIIVG